MNNLTLLQQIRGSMRNPEPLSEENFCKVAEPGLTFAEAKKACAAAGVDIGKILVDLQRTVCNIYYADYESGVYFVVELTSKLLPGGGPVFKAYTVAQKKSPIFKGAGLVQLLLDRSARAASNLGFPEAVSRD